MIDLDRLENAGLAALIKAAQDGDTIAAKRDHRLLQDQGNSGLQSGGPREDHSKVAAPRWSQRTNVLI